MYAVIGKGWFLTFRSERKADEFCLYVRAKYRDMVWVEKL
jgi:hypothetical protein